MTLDEILDKASLKLNIPKEVVEEAYKSYWRFIRGTIKELDLRDDISQEEFDKLRTNFNIPSLGKLYCDYNRYKGVRKRFEYIRRLRNDKYKESKTDVF